MKAIQFTDLEIASLECSSFTHSAYKKIHIAKNTKGDCVISDNDLELVVTPSKALEKVSERTQAARIENEKRIAKQMIHDLTLKHEKLADEYVELNNRNLQLCAENQKAVEIMQEYVDGFRNNGGHKTCKILFHKAKDFINDKLF